MMVVGGSVSSKAMTLWMLFVALVVVRRTNSLRLDVGIPGLGRISYRDGVLRIRPPLSETTTYWEVPPKAFEDKSFAQKNLCIEARETPSKGYGAFCGKQVPVGFFLGFYEGQLVSSKEALENLHKERTGSGVSDYVMALDGGVHFLDGYELRYPQRKDFTPAHLNHADSRTPECNVVRKLVYIPDSITKEDWEYPRELPRVAFFAARDVAIGEELCFDYGTNFWKDQSKKKV